MLERNIHPSEDTLTAGVFTYLLHLPRTTLWSLLQGATLHRGLPPDPGEIEEAELRPNWNPTETDRSSRVVPDLFIRFERLDLIVEAKRWDANQHYRQQWSNEVQAYLNEYGPDDREVHLIAIGNHSAAKAEEITLSWTGEDGGVPQSVTCPVHPAQWSRLGEEVLRAIQGLEQLAHPWEEGQAALRILRDLQSWLGLHGVSRRFWLADMRRDWSALLGGRISTQRFSELNRTFPMPRSR